jgi:hypothetical protein
MSSDAPAPQEPQPTNSGSSPDANPPEVAEVSSSEPALSATQTTLARRWVLRVLIILIIGWGLFVWGLYDAMVLYPNRGIDAASYLKYQYLREVDKVKPSSVSVDDPVAEFDRLKTRKRDNTMSTVESARFNWLEALSRVSRLKPEYSKVGDAKQELKELDERWGAANVKVPQPLEGYDIPSQWAIAGVGLLIGMWRLITFLGVASKKYRWNPETSTITLPGGATLNEADIVDYDKRKWDKFIITLALRDGHALGKETTLDLYPYNELEPWVLELERRGTGKVSEPPKDS